MQHASLIDRTITLFPRLADERIAIESLEKGGSDRRYYRMRMSHAHSMILVKYGHHREENRHYVRIAAFLESLGVRVPEVYFHDEDEGLIWMEDLGTEDLWAHRAESWQIRGGLYHSALRQVLKLHRPEAASAVTPDLCLQAGFTSDLYHWEQRYFFDNCLLLHLGLAPDKVENEAQQPWLAVIADRLAAQPATLVHRDFQSQNIIICNGEACLIDFQGLRPGLPQYDLASVLYDPYVALTESERKELFLGYTTLATESGAQIAGDFTEIYELCAMQRLMQALGAYGFLGHERGKREFLAHIPPALASLRSVLSRIEGSESLLRLLSRVPNSV